MIPLAVNMKRRPSFPHFALAVHAFHECLLILNPESHSPVSGTYAVMMARYSPLGAQTTWIFRPPSPVPNIRQLWPSARAPGRAGRRKRRPHFAGEGLAGAWGSRFRLPARLAGGSGMPDPYGVIFTPALGRISPPRRGIRRP